MGRSGAGAGPRGGPSAARLDRLLGVSLVPRDGARIVRRRIDRRAHERAVRVCQGRPRGASGHRRDLHGRLPGTHRPRGMAAERLPHPRGCAVLRGYLLPARTPPRAAELADGARRRRRRLVDAARPDHSPGRAAGRGAQRERQARAVDGAVYPGAHPRRARRAVGHVRPRKRWLRSRPEIPAGVRDRAAAGARRARDVPRDARGDGPRRHL